MTKPLESDEKQQEQELELDAAVVQDLEVDEQSADDIRGGPPCGLNSYGH
jgi:hypothetical protein